MKDTQEAQVVFSGRPLQGSPSPDEPPRAKRDARAKPALVAGFSGRPALLDPLTSAAGAVGPPPMMGPPSDAITQYIEVEQEARQCADLDTLRFLIVNATRTLANFEQAFLVEPGMTGSWSITRAAHVASIDNNAPLMQAVSSWLAAPPHLALLQKGEPRQMDLALEWPEWGLTAQAPIASQALWLPIRHRNVTLGALLALKRDSWRPQHLALLVPLAGAFGHAWLALLPKTALALSRREARFSPTRVGAALAVAGALAAFVPVPMSALAPAEIVAAAPDVVTAPIDGVIQDVRLAPGTWVDKGTPIVSFVDIKLRNEVEVASRQATVAEARHFKFVQSATATQKDMAEVAGAKAELDVADAELAYAREMLARSEILAPSAGLLIYAAKSDWVGKPVVTGERLMEIGNPDNLEIRIELPVSDALVLAPGGRLSLFLDGDPLSGLSGTITRTSYRPTLSSDQQLVFRIFGRFDDPKKFRIGLRGVARVSGEKVPLWLYLFRRPMAALRQRIGL